MDMVHEGLPDPSTTGRSHLIKGSYRYFHYSCDGFKDQVSNKYHSIEHSLVKCMMQTVIIFFFRAGDVPTGPSSRWPRGL